MSDTASAFPAEVAAGSGVVPTAQLSGFAGGPPPTPLTSLVYVATMDFGNVP